MWTSLANTTITTPTSTTKIHPDHIPTLEYVSGISWDGTNNKLAWSKGGTAQTAITIGYATSSGSAGSATSATTASKLSNTSKIGDTNKPVYFTASGVPAAISYTIEKSVPSNAVFTDTTYSNGTGLSLSGTTFNHTNSVTAQTTQALYPIKIDAQGHISAYGSAVTSLPASDVYAWAKAANPPSLDNISDGSTRKLSNYLPLSGGTMSNSNLVTNLNADLVDGEQASAFAHRGAANNLLVAGNEFNFISAGFTGHVWFNYQDENRQNAALVSGYYFGNGQGSSMAYIGASGSSFGASISVTGQISSTGDQIITSDETKKMNLEDIRLSVRDIASVRAVTFDLKADGSHSFGTIAQDWLGILPEAVLGEEGDYSFAYAQAAMVSSIINSREIVKHESEIEMLRRRVSELEAEVSQLRAN